MQKEKDFHIEWFYDIVSDNSEYVEVYGFDSDLEDNDKYDLFLHSNHEEVNSCLRESLVAKIDFNHRDKPIKEQVISSILVSPEGFNEWHKLEELDNKIKIKVIKSLDFLPFLQTDFSIKTKEDEYEFTINAFYENNDFKFFITDSNDFDSNAIMSIKELKRFIVNEINGIEENDTISPKDIKIKEVFIEEDSSDYELLLLDDMDKNLPKNHYLVLEEEPDYESFDCYTTNLIEPRRLNIKNNRKLENLILNNSKEIDEN